MPLGGAVSPDGQRTIGDPDDLPGADDLGSADENLVAWFTVLATSSTGGRVERGDGYLLFAGAHEYPGTYTNGVIRVGSAGASTTTPAELLARADAFFGALRRPYVTWVRNHLDADLDAELRRRGHWPRPPESGSELIWARIPSTSTLPAAQAPVDVEVYETDRDDDREAFLGLVGEGYGLTGARLPLVEALLFSVTSLRAPGVHLEVAKLRDGGEIGGGMATFDAAGGVQLGWNVTDPVLRGRGIASAVMWSALGRAQQRGARFACGVASQQGVSLWRRLGFSTPTSYKRFVAPTPAAPPPAGSSTSRRRRSRT